MAIYFYRAKTGSGQALVDLVYVGGTTTRFDPFSTGFRYPERVFSISGLQFTDGNAFTEWRFNAMSYADKAALDTLLGVSLTTISAAVTIYTLKAGTTFARCNATAHFPLEGDGFTKRQGGLVDVMYLFTNLVEL